MADLYDMLYIIVRIDVLHFCIEASFRFIFEVKWAPFRLHTEVIWEAFGCFWQLWGVLFWMLFFKMDFLNSRRSEGCFF